MRRRAQARLIKSLACAAGSESIEGWRAKIETRQSRTLRQQTEVPRGGRLTMEDFHNNSAHGEAEAGSILN